MSGPGLDVTFLSFTMSSVKTISSNLGFIVAV